MYGSILKHPPEWHASRDGGVGFNFGFGVPIWADMLQAVRTLVIDTSLFLSDSYFVVPLMAAMIFEFNRVSEVGTMFSHEIYSYARIYHRS
jgi:hypothetical protein